MAQMKKETKQRRNRAETERRLIDVAHGAGVNRGNIYHYFGSRQERVRAAINRRFEAVVESLKASKRDTPFVARRLDTFRATETIYYSQLRALLVLDGATVRGQPGRRRSMINNLIHCQLLIAAIVGCTIVTPTEAEETRDAADNVYFGDIHIHTRCSNDAFAFMTNRTPDDTYRFARGEPLDQVGGSSIKLHAPLDFMAVTDHAESLGVLHSFLNPDHPNSDDKVVQMTRSKDPATRFQAFYEWRKSRRSDEPSVFDDPAAVSYAWQDIVAAADRHYEPGKFTTFAAYEWTASKNLGNLHRNVIFEHTDDLPLPLPAENHEPETLWSYMESHRQRGVDSLAIPHN